jgi:leucyl-tRNA synthetase
MMEFTNEITPAYDAATVSLTLWCEAIEKLLLLLAPMGPHITEELWERTGHTGSIHAQQLPTWDDTLIAEEEVTLVVQVNGKLRDRITVKAGISEEDAKQAALGSPRIRPYIDGKDVTKVIYVSGRALISIVVKGE